LPEFILSDEIKIFEEFIRKHDEKHRNNHSYSAVRLIAYTSYAESPRLLKSQHLEYLARLVSKRVNRRIELSVIDPRRERDIVRLGENLVIRYIKPIPREEFYKLVINSDLFIELCVDEELRNTSIEVALLEIPVAKLTHPKYIDRQDYDEDDLIQEYSFKKLAERLVDYLNNIEHYKPYYAKKLKTFIIKHRTWDVVKKTLIKYIKDA
jgi:DNA-binding HxlR family transcriptional regulator